MATELLLIIGGARSGKSDFALRRALQSPFSHRTFLATATPGDAEMAARIQRHQSDRGSGWLLREEPYRLDQALRETATDPGGLVLVDCLTLWASNLLCGVGGPEVHGAEAGEAVARLLSSLPGLKGSVWFVTNEVGAGVVPDQPLAREYRDLLGRANLLLAQEAHETYLLVAGLALPVKELSNLEPRR